VNLSLAIIFLWIGCVLLSIAFHPLPLESGTGSPTDVMHSLQSKAASGNSAYDSLPTGDTQQSESSQA
jgi:hypothetical protein